MDVIANELLEVSLAFNQEVRTDSAELVRPTLGHFQGKLLYVLFVDESGMYAAHNRSLRVLRRV